MLVVLVWQLLGHEQGEQACSALVCLYLPGVVPEDPGHHLWSPSRDCMQGLASAAERPPHALQTCHTACRACNVEKADAILTQRKKNAVSTLCHAAWECWGHVLPSVRAV